MLERLQQILRDPPPAAVFEISEAGIAVARIATRAGLEFRPLPAGTVAVSPMKENVADGEAFAAAVKALTASAGTHGHDAALILPDFCARLVVLDFDSFPSDSAEQLSLIRFRLKRGVPFNVEDASVSYFAQPAKGGKLDVLVAATPHEIVAGYEAPFRAAGWNPGLVTISALAALDLVPPTGIDVTVKLAGRVLSVVVRREGVWKLARCIELPAPSLDEIAAVLLPTLVYIEDTLGASAGQISLIGFGPGADEAARRLSAELNVETGITRSPLGAPGENNAGLLGYLHSIGRDN
jgi:type IV pilus assembly protein PilM